MKKIQLLCILTSGLLIFGLSVKSQQIAFPGAEGYGKYATGGRGGRIVEVTNLNDQDRYGKTIDGSFRAALNTAGTDPITIVFRVSGIIELKSELKSSRSNMTIAGQTAPGDGICIKDESIKLSGKNLIVRYIRFRPGDELKAQTSGLNIENSGNFIVDHCSMSWAVEENTGFYDNINTTIQWCFISEGLYDSYHEKGPRSYGGQWGGQYTSYHHNLLAHNRSRSPRINGSRAHDTVALVDFRNNVIFNWGVSGAIYGGEMEIDFPTAVNQTNMINNYYKPGPGTSSGLYFCRPTYVTDGNIAYGFGQWYLSGNYMESVTGGINDNNWSGILLDDIQSNSGKLDSIDSDTEFPVSQVTTYTAQETYDSVLAYAGATRPIRDSVDIRIIREMKGEIAIVGGNSLGAGKGIIDSQTEVGGWPGYYTPLEDSIPVDSDKDGMPDYWETEQGLNPNDSLDGPVIAADGYSNLEHYLNSDIPYIEPYIPIDTTDTTSTIQLIETSFTIHPNPANTCVTINSESVLTKVELLGLDGKQLILINSVNEKKQELSLSGIPSGIYLIRATFRNGYSSTNKLLIKNQNE